MQDQPSTPTSPEIAARRDTFSLWDPDFRFPAPDLMEDLDVVTHVVIERAATDGYHYLHESALAQYQGKLHTCWANHRTTEFNICGEIIRGAVSADAGLTWRPPRILAQPPEHGSNSYNHPVLGVHQGRLWGFFTRWDGDLTEQDVLQQGLGCCNPPGVGPQPSTELFIYDAAADTWASSQTTIPGFIPFHPPTKCANGNWIVGGELCWYDAAVAISRGNDWSQWRVIPIERPDPIELYFPETALIDQGERLLAICRPRNLRSAPVAESRDCGETWTPLQESNFPLAESQPCAGTLADGRHYLITCNLEDGRALLSIALTEPHGQLFSTVRKVRHQRFPRRRHFPGAVHKGTIPDRRSDATEWSYPAAIEHQDALYISYTQGKEDCVLSIIPTRAL